MKSGLYITTLKNKEPISVNAQDKRIAHKAIKVTFENCKFGKAKNLDIRKKNYEKTFGVENVNFQPIATLLETELAEKEILSQLDVFRIRGRTGRKNEWLQGIEPEIVYSIAMKVLKELDLDYQIVNK